MKSECVVLICYVKSYMIEILFTGLPAHPPTVLEHCRLLHYTEHKLAGWFQDPHPQHRVHLHKYVCIYICIRCDWCYMVPYGRCILICLYRVTWICIDSSGELIARMWSRWHVDVYDIDMTVFMNMYMIWYLNDICVYGTVFVYMYKLGIELEARVHE